MGIKLAMIVAVPESGGSIGGELVGDLDDAKELLRVLGYGLVSYRDRIRLEEAWYPDEGEVCVGRYEHGVVITDGALVRGILRKPMKDMERKPMLEAFPAERIFVAHLHSVTNDYGHATFMNGAFVRGQAGDSEKPVRYDEGDLHPIEGALRARSVMKRRRRYYPLNNGELVDDSAMGEDVVMKLLAEHAGVDLGADSGLEVARFDKTARLVFWKRSPETKTAMISQAYAAIEFGESHPAMASFDVRALGERVSSQLQARGLDAKVDQGEGSHGPWLTVDCGFELRASVRDALLPLALQSDLLVYAPHAGSVYNNKRSY